MEQRERKLFLLHELLSAGLKSRSFARSNTSIPPGTYFIVSWGGARLTWQDNSHKEGKCWGEQRPCIWREAVQWLRTQRGATPHKGDISPRLLKQTHNQNKWSNLSIIFSLPWEWICCECLKSELLIVSVAFRRPPPSQTELEDNDWERWEQRAGVQNSP